VKIAFLHYHLKPGGVTTVLRHQVLALQKDSELLVISGEPGPIDFPCDVAHVPGIGYHAHKKSQTEIDAVVEQIALRIRRQFHGPCDLIHIHNPLLAKNAYFLDIINGLQQYGFTLFLQVHDFAEDGRPNTYFRDRAYPKDCHYGVINSRDYHILIHSGLSTDGVHYLPNCVLPLGTMPVSPTEDYLLYPVRAIRRKNIGEALLMSCFLPKNWAVFITQPPNSPADFPSYNQWKSYAAAHRLAMGFEMGIHRPFPDLVAGARQVLTTSITEGFGFAFLEPWTVGKPLTGRLLPEICRDFTAEGIRLDHLYAEIALPMDWIGREKIIDRFAVRLETSRAAYGRNWPTGWNGSCLRTLNVRQTIDFGMLDEPFQMEILDMLRDRPALKEELIRLNPFLQSVASVATPDDLVNANRERILSLYHPSRYRERLQDIYTRILGNPVRHAIDRKSLLSGFLTFENFSLLKWNLPDDG